MRRGTIATNRLAERSRVMMIRLPIPRDRSMHGLRYAAAAGLDEAGCTVTEAVAVMGHRTYHVVLKYMARRRASEAAMPAREGREEP